MPQTPPRKASSLRAALSLVMALLLGMAAGIVFGPGLKQLYAQLTASKPDQLSLQTVDFAQLPGWQQDDLDGFLPAFLRSCKVFQAYAPDRRIGRAAAGGRFGVARDWAEVCSKAAQLPPDMAPAQRRTFMEQNFVPLRAANRDKAVGRFTGYYEPQLRGSRQRQGAYQTPLRRVPDNLISVDLGAFRENWRGEKIAGRIKDGKLLPLPPRSEIVAGALDSENLDLLYVDDPVDAFFLHIQGSGRVRLEDGRVLRLGYAGQNGHPYVAIGKVLVEQGEMTRETVSMQSIRAWLKAHPERRDAMLAANPSYVFFRALADDYPDLGPPGSQGVPLTPGRSLAIDPGFHALGMPVWLDSVTPDGDMFQRLMVAQDTGGAIRGPVRGDVFWGFGEQAAEIAGRMNAEGRLYVLLPRGVAEKAVQERK